MRVSREPQKIDDSCWYYENDGSIDVILSLARVSRAKKPALRKGARFSLSGDQFVHIRIPSSQLIQTLKRQGKC